MFHALSPNRPQKLEDLKKFCTSNVFSISRSINGIFDLLRYISLVKIVDGLVTVDSDIFFDGSFPTPNDYFTDSHFFNQLFIALENSLSIDYIFNSDNLRFSSAKGQYYVKSHLIKFEYFPIRNLLSQLSFLEEDSLVPDHLFISKGFTEFFKQNVVDKILAKKNKFQISLDQLRRRLDLQEKIGKHGELFVLKFEKIRLSQHPNSDAIVRISEDYVNAGYDIISFDSADSILLDRFIEVKTYTDEVSFYWSKNEIEIAKELGSQYWLYLVDLSLINNPDYSPRLFQDPYTKVFENQMWQRDVEKWWFYI